jgi:hypothetical protein
MKVLVEFTKDYANKKKGDKESYNSMLASGLIQKKVAKIFKKEVKKSTKK